ncbi:MAG: GNAT family N-acetyltransferase [Alphaproteobacteria bacterium]|jgi:N-acetylglutamate synthase-like GNAT family acetyltransferase|nr:GNAT family N-acetyltransferase [Alphaproteobacteria bacterium]
MSITFSTFMNEEWREKIESKLATQLEEMSHFHAVKSQNIFAFHELHLIGGTIFQINKDILWVDGLWVESNFRKRGVGKSLLQQIVDLAKQQNLKAIQLNTYFAEARDFFKACGFEEVATIPEWKYGLTCHLLKKAV